MQLLVFVSSHCPHCPKAVAIVKKVIFQYNDYNIEYKKVRAKTAGAKEISGRYGIKVYPTIIGLNNENNTMFRIVGVPSEDKLRNEIKKLLGLKKSFFNKLFGGKS